MMFTHQIDYLQKELLAARSEAGEKVLELNNQIKELQNLNKIQEDLITNQRNKIKELKYQHDISQKALSYKLEKSE